MIDARLTERSRKVLDLALREALSLGHNYIGTEHILLGLVREEGGIGGRILREHGLDSQRALDAVIAHVTAKAPPKFRVNRVNRNPPVTQLTEADLRRIVREALDEIKRRAA